MIQGKGKKKKSVPYCFKCDLPLITVEQAKNWTITPKRNVNQE